MTSKNLFPAALVALLLLTMALAPATTAQPPIVTHLNAADQLELEAVSPEDVEEILAIATSLSRSIEGASEALPLIQGLEKLPAQEAAARLNELMEEFQSSPLAIPQSTNGCIHYRFIAPEGDDECGSGGLQNDLVFEYDGDDGGQGGVGIPVPGGLGFEYGGQSDDGDDLLAKLAKMGYQLKRDLRTFTQEEDIQKSDISWVATDTEDEPIAEGEWTVTHPLLQPAEGLVHCVKKATGCITLNDVDPDEAVQTLEDIIDQTPDGDEFLEVVESLQSEIFNTTGEKVDLIQFLEDHIKGGGAPDLGGELFGGGLGLVFSQVGTIMQKNEWVDIVWDETIKEATGYAVGDEAALCALVIQAGTLAGGPKGTIAGSLVCLGILAYTAYYNSNQSDEYCGKYQYEARWGEQLRWRAVDANGYEIGRVDAEFASTPEASREVIAVPHDDPAEGCFPTEDERSDFDYDHREITHSLAHTFGDTTIRETAEARVTATVDVLGASIPVLQVVSREGDSNLISGSSGHLHMDYSGDAAVCVLPMLSGEEPVVCLDGFDLRGEFKTDDSRHVADAFTSGVQASLGL